MRILYALIPSYVSGELWQNPPLLRLLSEIIANAKEALQREGIILAVIEPALSLHHVTLAEGLSLMQTYCHLSDCVVSFDRVYDQYPSPLIDFMFMSAREQGRPIIAADCVRPALGERNSLVTAATSSVMSGPGVITVAAVIDAGRCAEDSARAF